MNDVVDVTAIRQLNDQLRKSLSGGVLVMTAGVRALDEARQLEVLDAVGAFDGFHADNDPYGEHDFGAIEVTGERVLFKIDYYDLPLTAHSPDPADASVTKRVNGRSRSPWAIIGWHRKRRRSSRQPIHTAGSAISPGQSGNRPRKRLGCATTLTPFARQLPRTSRSF